MMTTFIREDRINPTAPNAPPPVRAGPGRAAAEARRCGGGRGGPSEAQRIARRCCTTPASARCSSRAAASTERSSCRRATPAPTRVPTVVVAGEHYNNLIRLLEDRVPVKVRVNVQGRYFTAGHERLQRHRRDSGHRSDVCSDEVVMIGAHLDSWHSATGATDNADGAATVLEAVRILKAVGAKPRRTIRFALWGGEEEGLYGSKAWVAQHLVGRREQGGARQVRRLLQHRSRLRPDVRLLHGRQRRRRKRSSTRGSSRSRTSARERTSSPASATRIT